MAKHILITRPNGSVTIVRKELETGSETPLTEHEKIINELQEKVENLTMSLVGVSVFCYAPEHIKPCRHEFSGKCQYNSHCNFKKN